MAEMALNFRHFVLVNVVLLVFHHQVETVTYQGIIVSQLYLFLLLHVEDADDFSILLEIDYLEQILIVLEFDIQRQIQNDVVKNKEMEDVSLDSSCRAGVIDVKF